MISGEACEPVVLTSGVVCCGCLSLEASGSGLGCGSVAVEAVGSVGTGAVEDLLSGVVVGESLTGCGCNDLLSVFVISRSSLGLQILLGTLTGESSLV